jgi:hypothetical protein
VQAVDVQLFADLLQHAQLDLAQVAIGSGHVAGQRIGGFVQAFGQGVADQAEQGGKAVLIFEQIEHGLSDHADAVEVIGRKDWHVVDHALDGDKFGGAHHLV